MNCEFVFTLLVLIGLVFNIGGALLIAFSIKFTQKIRLFYETDGKRDNNVEAILTQYKKGFFWCGVWILIMGFIFQFIGVLLELILS